MKIWRSYDVVKPVSNQTVEYSCLILLVQKRKNRLINTRLRVQNKAARFSDSRCTSDSAITATLLSFSVVVGSASF